MVNQRMPHEDLFTPRPEKAAAPSSITVTELNRRIKGMLEGQFGTIWVEGEISNYRPVSSGHIYFTLKDAGSQITVAFFKGNQRNLKSPLKDGLHVRVLGDVTLYLERGQHQLVARIVEPAGKGNLQEAFEALKAKLMAEGLFDPARKRPLPALPRHIGIVTSPTGAALQDILTVLNRRFPDLHILLAPVKVQGDGAAAEIARAIDLLNTREDLDVLIVGRGGGSIEDLWSFNEEAVARAVARSRLPVISAVGHEIDFTICDFVADLRAPTPSAAAEIVVQPQADLEAMVFDLRGRLTRALENRLLQLRHRLTRAAHSYVFHEPRHLLRQRRQDINQMRMRLAAALQGEYRERQQRLDTAHEGMAAHARAQLKEKRLVLNRLESQVRALGPMAVLERGYTITRGADGRALTSVNGIKDGATLITVLADGQITSITREIERNET